MCASGLVLVAAGLFVLAQLNGTSSYGLVLAGLLPLGAGMGAAMTPATSPFTEALPPRSRHRIRGQRPLTRTWRRLGIAVVGSVLSSVYTRRFTLPSMSHLPHGAAAYIAEKAQDSIAIAAHLGGPIAQAVTNAFVGGLHVAPLICSGSALAAAPRHAGAAKGAKTDGQSASEPSQRPAQG